jgi:anhydro-N-acetylmuramic acid kinase
VDATLDTGRTRFLIGLMCGTSGDGAAGAVIETSGYGTQRAVTVLAHRIDPYPQDFRDRLFRLFPPQSFTATELGILHRDMGELLAGLSLRLLDDAGIPPAKLSAVGVQAPTLLHMPPLVGTLGVHLEVGDATIIAERLRTRVVCDLRPSDIAAGGHGAPLSASVDYWLFTHPTSSRALQNIGGIANVTYLPRAGGIEDTLAFDTGPGNMLIDGVVARLTERRMFYDAEGAWAARGRIDVGLLGELMSHPYVERPLPKTSGREDFGEFLVDQVLESARRLKLADADIIATVTAFTAECIRYHYQRDLEPLGGVDEMILYGGGAHNRTLVRYVSERLPRTRIRSHDEFGIPGDARECVTWAILADETLAGHPGNVPSASGARRRVMLGKIVQLGGEGT